VLQFDPLAAFGNLKLETWNLKLEFLCGSNRARWGQAMTAIYSMTGFGRAQQSTPLGTIGVELRTVNNRFQDLSVSLPRELASLEAALRAMLQAAIPRGKIDARVRLSAPAAALQAQVRINRDLARRFMDELRALDDGQAVPLQVVTALPGVVELAPPDLDEAAVWGALEGVVRDALAALQEARAREGAALAGQLRALVGEMQAAVGRIESRQPEILERWRRKLGDRLEELSRTLNVPVEPARLAMEVALYADRSDVSEELVRLRAHLERFDGLLADPSGEPTGKSLEFLMQELLREVNTLGSKCRDTEALGETLAMKSIVEKMREQVANIQ
jgi:uncharacterized protein (TIGR00255 family)